MAGVLRAISDMVLRLSRLLLSSMIAQNEQLESTGVTTSARPSSARLTTFRLLDLPPEIRNLIYGFAAKAAFEVPAMPLYSGQLSFIIPPPHFPRMNYLCMIHDQRRNGGFRNRLAMLYTNRQIYREASQIYYSNMSLDLRMEDVDKICYPILQLINIFKHSLQNVQHVELDFNLLDEFLFIDGKHTFKALHEELQETEIDMEFIQAVKQQPRLRTYLFAIKTITAYSDDAPDDEVLGYGYVNTLRKDECQTGINLMYSLANPYCRRTATRTFPNLQDIICISPFGGERFRKGTAGWELWYSHERLPTAMFNPAHFYHGHQLWDHATGLPISTTLACIGPPDSTT